MCCYLYAPGRAKGVVARFFVKDRFFLSRLCGKCSAGKGDSALVYTLRRNRRAVVCVSPPRTCRPVSVTGPHPCGSALALPTPLQPFASTVISPLGSCKTGPISAGRMRRSEARRRPPVPLLLRHRATSPVFFLVFEIFLWNP